ncbi:MAG: hypothetical protein ACMUIS_00355 [bacterium]
MSNPRAFPPPVRMTTAGDGLIVRKGIAVQDREAGAPSYRDSFPGSHPWQGGNGKKQQRNRRETEWTSPI